MRTLETLKEIQDYLPPQVRTVLAAMPEQELEQIQEIRLRNQKPFGIVKQGREECQNAVIRFEDIARSFQAICSYSVYSYEQELAEGYLTIRGGCRVGICGSAVREENQIKSLKYISGLNFRIAGERPGIAETLWHQTSGSLLIAGTVGSGKTTWLRDLCRLAGKEHRTALIDERGELAAVCRGVPAHDVGRMTDVFDGYPRAAGILTALRVMNPEYILCDEIGTPEDVQAVLQAAGCGVKLAAACHAGSPDEIRKRPVLRPLLEAGIFQYAAFLQNGSLQIIRRLA